MSDAAQAAAPLPPKAKRERSPSFPFIPLKTALARLTAFDEYSKRHPVPAKHAGQAWGMKGYTSQAQQTLAALKSFGLIEYQGSGESLIATITDDARTYLRAQQESIKLEVVKRVALKPKNLAKYFALWGAIRPQDPICLDVLVLKDGFNEGGAKAFLSVYDETIAFAGLSDSDKSPDKVEPDAPKPEELSRVDPPSPPPSSIKVGDYVQWTSGGVDQLKPPRKVLSIMPDGAHAQVFGYNGALPMSELEVAAAPAPEPAFAASRMLDSTVWKRGESKFDVYQHENRLQITADVDLDGIAELKEMLGHYEAILKLRERKKLA